MNVKKELFIAVIGTALLVFLIIGAVFLYKTASQDRLSETVTNENGEVERVSVRSRSELKRDDDGDTLKNWEEALWQTDINNPDTDGDGMIDGEEVAARRDPKKPGPGDSIDFATQTREMGIIQTTEYIKQNANEGVSVKSSTVTPDTKSTPNLTQSPLKAYGNQLATILRAHFNTVTEEGETFLKITQDGDSSELQKLFVFAKKYRSIGTEVAKTEVPESAKELQADLVTAYNTIAQEMENMARNQNTFSTSTAFFANYKSSMDGYAAVFYSFMDYFKKNEVQFSPNEPGYLFTPVF